MPDIQNHNDNITINVTLSAVPAQEAGFGTVLLMVPLASNSLNGARSVRYTDYATAAADQGSGYISSGTLAAIAVAFAQRPAPADILVGNVDLAGSPAETYATALPLIEADDPDFYGICAATRTGADVEALATVVETQDRIYISQSSDADWLTSGYPSAFVDLEDMQNAATVYHTTDAQWADVAWACGALAFDPDVQSIPWDRPLKGVSAYSANLTAAQKGFAEANNANLMLPYGGAAAFLDAGVNHEGRPVADVITAHWLKKRLTERLAALKVRESTAGRKIPMTAAGQMQVMGVLTALFAQGVAAGHFVDGQTEVLPVTLSSTDISTGRMRFTARAQPVSSGRLFTFNINVGTDALTA